MKSKSYECCILGAGPAGLGAAVELADHGVGDIIIIDRNETVGGLARTEEYGGARFDVGPHRFFTKNTEINELWHNLLGDDFRPVDRLTRIFYKNKLFNYPVKALDALTKLGPVESIHAMLSFAASRFGMNEEPVTFEDWITQKFGRKLYDTFFKTYTEKVWGIPCSEIGAEWAAQRIKGLDITSVIKNALFGGSGREIKTLVDQFDYPVLGAGQMYEAMRDKAVAAGATLTLGSTVVAFNREGNRIDYVEVVDENGERWKVSASCYFNSVPITNFFKMLSPSADESILKAVRALYYREHITVDLLVGSENLFPDQWIYIHSPDVRMARVANHNNFSQQMVGAKGKTALSIEYFVFQHDDLWQMKDDDLKALAVEELEHIKLLEGHAVENSWVVRETESYPTYYIGFADHYEVLKARLDDFVNLYPIGRGGMYKYNNQDHSTMSGLLAARNYLRLPGSPYNLWEINIDAEYHESAKRT